LACWYGHKYIAARLLDSNAHLDVTNCDGNCALNVAAYRGNSEAVDMLLRHRATVDVPDHMTGKTALVKAAYVGNTPTAIALLDAKADVNTADNQGYTSLAFATSFGHEYMLQVLLHSDADPNPHADHSDADTHSDAVQRANGRGPDAEHGGDDGRDEHG